ncbi:MAG: SDR family oxidoreductase [Hyphomonas oceanitis]|uniref:SDR family oxidoreductase n=1 Tax=Hyphomonas oceanitis TaxID=81033 RepID=UPI003002F027
MVSDSSGLLKGKRVVITAGANGIGLAMARHFLEQGATVCICDVDGAAISRLSGSYARLHGFEVDVADPTAVGAFFKAAEQTMGGLDILVNNAGIAGPTALCEDVDIEDWHRTIDVDLNAQFYCAKYAIPLLKASGGGSIVMMASNAALFGFPMRSPYTAAKWALVGLTKTLAMELGPHGIRVNALCPCSVEGPRIDGVIEREAAKRGVSPQKIREDYQRQSSLRTFVRADDVAAMAFFLVSDAGAKISGQAIGVDGHTESLAQL